MNLLNLKTVNGLSGKPTRRNVVGCVLFFFGLTMLAGCNKNRENIRAGKVVGGSMAPSFLGEHVFFECRTCQSAVTADLEQSNDRERLTCPYCGALTDRQDCEQRAADSVEIVVGAPIKRWDVVAFKVPESTDSGIKRVVGLPGEQIQIRDGNLFANGRLIRKSIESQRSVRILVHDSKKTDLDNMAWFSKAPSGKFEFIDGSFQLGDSMSRQDDLSWIEYRQRRCYSRRPGGDSESNFVPVEDNYGYNQSIGRDLHPINDVFVELEVEALPASVINWNVLNQFGEFNFSIDVEKRCLKISKPDCSKSIMNLDDSCFSKPVIRIEFSCFDQQILVVVNGQSVYQHSFELSLGKPESEWRGARFQVGTPARLTINRIRIWRDLYYLAGDGVPGSTQAISGKQGGYVLLGDNIPISVDSRHWQPATISAKQIIGRVSAKRK